MGVAEVTCKGRQIKTWLADKQSVRDRDVNAKSLLGNHQNSRKDLANQSTRLLGYFNF